MDDKRLSEIEARVNAATGGWWLSCDGEGGRHNPHVYSEPTMYPNGLTGGRHHHWDRNIPMTAADGEFVRYARTDIPDLLAYVHQLRARIAALEAALEPADFDL